MTIDDVYGAMERGDLPRPIGVTPPPVEPDAPRPPRPAPMAPHIDVEPQPWQRPSWPTAAAPVTRAGADIHMRSATAHAVCGATESPIASVADPTQVTCRACRLMISAPHISPCTTERWLRDTPAPEPEPVATVEPSPNHRAWPVAAAVAGLGTVALALVAIVALSGHAGPSSSASTGGAPSDIHTVGGGVAQPTAFATALPTVEPTPAPTEAPTAAPTPAPTLPPASQNQVVNVIDTNGQTQQQSQAQAQASQSAQAQASGAADPPAPTSITFVNNSGRVVDLYFDRTGQEYSAIAPGYKVDQPTYVGQVWDVKTDPCCVGGGGNVQIMQVTATPAAQTINVTGQ